MKADSLSGLKEIYNATDINLQALSALKEPVDKWSVWLVYINVEKMDP